MDRDFSVFSKAVERRLSSWANQELYVVGGDKDAVWDRYLASFPEGTNPVYRVRTEHDCSCCKNFVRNFGNVVAIVNGKVETIWNVQNVGHPYEAVAAAMDEFVQTLPIASVFRSRETRYGNASTLELVDGRTRKWDHFVGTVAARHHCRDVDAERGRLDSAAQVLRRGLDELTSGAIETVRDLISENAIYRGQEHERAVTGFAKLQEAYRKLNSDAARAAFVWENINSPAARFRNSVIGTLVDDLSKGVDLEKAVRSFETKVAPGNYKRPTAVITQTMVKDAMKTITDLGLESALERRFAKLSDVSVNNVLFVDGTVRPMMKDGLEALLLAETKTAAPNLDRAEAITIDRFMADVLPRASTLDLFVENRMQPNFMSLTAPVHAEPKSLFRWDNDFAWSYDGNMADSDIREKVKRAGGNVEAALRISLAWFNTDDLDIHCFDPSGRHIYFGNKQDASGKTVLDVDMNVVNVVRNPVENLSWATTPRDGAYRIEVNNYRRRETRDVGFVLEVENNGALWTFRHTGGVSDGRTVEALTVHMKGGAVSKIDVGTGLSGATVGQEKWGVKTETLVKVNTLLLSPNYWDDNATGNKHWFFILDGCRNPEPARGIYNEFLNPVLEKHRKVFEVLGNKTKCPVTDEQLSGIGFSSTRNDTAKVLVKGTGIQKAYNITF